MKFRKYVNPALINKICLCCHGLEILWRGVQVFILGVGGLYHRFRNNEKLNFVFELM